MLLSWLTLSTHLLFILPSNAQPLMESHQSLFSQEKTQGKTNQFEQETEFWRSREGLQQGANQFLENWQISQKNVTGELPLVPRSIQNDTIILDSILKRGNLLAKADAWNGKILVVRVNEAERPHKFQRFYYQALYQDINGNQKQDEGDRGFFNPASTIKVGIAALVLEKLHQMELGRETDYRPSGTQQWYRVDDDIRRALVISDNQATNRLILLLGFESLNQRMQAKGLKNFAVNRLLLDRGQLVDSPAFEFRFQGRMQQQGTQRVTRQFACQEVKQKLGNCATALDLVEILTRIVQPEYFTTQEGFNLRSSDRLWLQQILAHTPRQEGFNYPDQYCRFLTEVDKKWSGRSGRMLSKCGIALFTRTYVDSSFLETDSRQKYYIVLAVTPPQSVAESEILDWMNQTINFILPRLPD